MTRKRAVDAELNRVYRYVKDRLENGSIQAGEKLPAERKIAEELELSRPKVRLALEKLESYGVLKIFPQSGSVIANHPVTAITNQISNIIDLDGFDFKSLVDVRILLESESIRLCALNRTESDVAMLEASHAEFMEHAFGPQREEKDFAFHAAIAKACHNPVIYSLLLFITPDVLDYYHRLGACTTSPESVIEEHKEMIRLISERKPDEAVAALLRHLAAIKEFAANKQYIVPRTRI